MSRATEDQLAALHGHLAKTFTAALEQSTRASTLLAVERDEPLPDDIVDFLESFVEVNPSLLTAATKFLKDNNISCPLGESSDLDELKATLNKKRQDGKGNVVNIPLD